MEKEIRVDVCLLSFTIRDLRPMTGDHNDSSSKMERNKSKTLGGIGFICIGLWFSVFAFVQKILDSREKIK